MAAPGITEGSNKKTWGGVDTNMPTALAKDQPPPLSTRLKAKAERKATGAVEAHQTAFEVLAVVTHALFDAVVTASKGGRDGEVKALDDQGRDSRQEAKVLADKLTNIIVDKDLEEAIRVLRGVQLEPLLQEAFKATDITGKLRELDINAQRILSAFAGLTGGDIIDLVLGNKTADDFQAKLQKLKDLLMEEIASNVEDALTDFMEVIAVVTHSLYDAIDLAHKNEVMPVKQEEGKAMPTPEIGRVEGERDSQREARVVCDTMVKIVVDRDFEEFLKILSTLPVGPLADQLLTMSEPGRFLQAANVDVHRIAAVVEGLTLGDLIQAAMGRPQKDDMKKRWQLLKEVCLQQFDLASRPAQEILAVMTHVVFDSIVASSSEQDLRDLKYDVESQKVPWEQRDPRQEAKVVCAKIDQCLGKMDFQTLFGILGTVQVSPVLHVLLENTQLGQVFDKLGIDRRQAVQDTKGTVLWDYIAAVLYPSEGTPDSLPDGAKRFKNIIMEKTKDAQASIFEAFQYWLGDVQRALQPYFEILAMLTSVLFNAMAGAGVFHEAATKDADARTQAHAVMQALQRIVTQRDTGALVSTVQNVELEPLVEFVAPRTGAGQKLTAHEVDVPHVARSLRGLTVGDLVQVLQGKQSLELQAKRFRQALLEEMDSGDQVTQEIKQTYLMAEAALLTGVNFADVFTNHVEAKDADSIASLLALFEAVRARRLRDEKKDGFNAPTLKEIDFLEEIEKLQHDTFLSEGARRALGRSAALTKGKVQSDVFVALGTLEWSIGTLLVTAPKLIPTQAAEGEQKGFLYKVENLKFSGIDFPLEGVKMTLLGASLPPRGALVNTPYGKGRMIGYKMSEHCFIVSLLDWPKRKDGNFAQAYMQPSHITLLESGTAPTHVDQETLKQTGTGSAAQAAEKLNTVGDKKHHRAPDGRVDEESVAHAMDFLSFSVAGGGGTLKNIRFEFEQTGFPHLKDSGTVDVWVSGVSLAISLNPAGVATPSASPTSKTRGGHKLREDKREAQQPHEGFNELEPVDEADVLAVRPMRIEVTEVRCEVEAVKTEIEDSKRDGFYNFMSSTFENLIKKQIKSNVESQIRDHLEDALEALNSKIAQQTTTILEQATNLRPRLMFNVEEAEELAEGKGPFGKRNLYIKFKVGYRGKPIATATTGVVRKAGLTPNWKNTNNVVAFTLPSTVALEDMTLDIEIWDTHSGDLGLKRDSKVAHVVSKDMADLARLVKHQQAVRPDSWWWRVDTGGRIKIVCDMKPPAALEGKPLQGSVSSAEAAEKLGAAGVLEAAALAKV